ncbi:MAG TPA: hypothetical protein PLD16_08710 [Fervidobacterium sp.]|nr:hypothetical protein [Fervidobacterium sp.]
MNFVRTGDLTADLSLFYRFFSGFYLIRYEKPSRVVVGYGPGDGKPIAQNYGGTVFRQRLDL